MESAQRELDIAEHRAACQPPQYRHAGHGHPHRQRVESETLPQAEMQRLTQHEAGADQAHECAQRSSR